MNDKFYQDYLEELKEIRPCTDKEREMLLGRLAAGDKKAGERLIEGHLIFALAIAKDFKDQGVLAGDLVQEANLALTMAVWEYREGDFLAQAKDRILAHIQAVIREQKQERETGEALAARVNVLQELSARMAGELGREATVEELAERMQTTSEEIKGMMKLAVDALRVVE